MKRLFCLFALGLSAVCLYAEGAEFDAYSRDVLARLPGKPVPLFETTDVGKLRTLADEGTAAFSVVDAADQPFSKALRVDVKRRTDPVWKIQAVSLPNLGPVRKDDVLFVTFSVRCTASSSETGGGQLFVALQQTPNYDCLTSLSAAPGKKWTVLSLKVAAPRDCPGKSLELAMHFGKTEQAFELGGLVAANLGPGVDLKQLPFTRIAYEGQAADAPWRQKALTRIENIRRGDLAIQVADADGKPVTNAAVHVRMTRHAYQFGTFIEDLVLLETDDGRKYRETVKRLFNRVTCPLYWSDWGWENPETRLRFIAVAQWAKENGFYTRGHNLIWPGWRWLPKGLEGLKDKPADLRRAIDLHLEEVATVMRPIGFDTYDVVNEPRVNHDVMDILSFDEVARWYKQVKDIDPRPALGINEYAIVAGGGDTVAEQDLYLQQIRALLNANAPLGVIGVQCHMGENLTPPQKVVEILDRLATLKLPIHATEFDINTDDEQTQADYLRDFLIAFFSHPATESVTQWGFWAGRHWIPRAALFDEKWRVKPAGQAYMDLVLKTWWTDETLTTDRLGHCRVRAFLGDHDVTVALPDGRTLTRSVRVARDGTVLNVKP